jgi:L-threonylcarbamoyladenylate synthase
MGDHAMHGIESTVVDCSGDIPYILRPGVITLEMLKKIDDRFMLHNSKGKPRSPGVKYKHYSPKAKLKLMNVIEAEKVNNTLDKAYIGINNPGIIYAKLLICKNEKDYAKNLFSFFRECDSEGYKTIIAEKINEQGIGLAIMNRLKKAAHHS